MVRKECSVCGGSGKIRNPKNEGHTTPYDSKITCPNCDGAGFIGMPENFPMKKPFILEF